MPEPLEMLADTIRRASSWWVEDDLSALTPSDLIRLNAALGHARRLIDGAQARVASEISRQSRPELGPDSLAKAQGFRSPTALIAATTGTTAGEAARLVQVGEATTPRMTFSGEAAPPRHPHVAASIASGRIGANAAAAIVRMLDRVAIRAGAEAVAKAEAALVAEAPGLTLDQLSRIILRIEAVIDPDGVEPRETDLRDARSLVFRQDANGMVVLTAHLDPEHAAPVKTAIEALVSAELRGRENARTDAAGPPAADEPSSRRTVAQMQADALVRFAEHMLGCAHHDVPLGGATVVVRIDHADLLEGIGHATIDGIAAPVSASAARRMAADAGVIAAVLGAQSEILDWGRTKRLFSPAQKLVIAERDGGCVNCGAPPGHTKVHHIRWWARDQGPTDIDNGVLLCESCHHRIHDNGWDIRVEGRGMAARVWLVPPAFVDRQRTPRAALRSRYRLAS